MLGIVVIITVVVLGRWERIIFIDIDIIVGDIRGKGRIDFIITIIIRRRVVVVIVRIIVGVINDVVGFF